MYIEKGGTLYNFCPGKATWDTTATSLFKMLIIAAETGTMIDEGGLFDQPQSWIDLLADFLPRYDDQKFFTRARSILGEVQSGGAGSGAKR